MIIGKICKDKTLALKGIAILCIAFHNFFHHIIYVGENEFNFNTHRVFTFFNTITSQPTDIIGTIFSFLGHYGVQAFILMSGYGLTKSMLNHRRDWLSFVTDRLTKLYPLLLTGIVIFIATIFLTEHRFLYDTEWASLKHKLLFIHTLLPNDGLSLIGPWWFFGLIFQLYLLFPLFFKLIEKHKTTSLIIVTLASYIIVYAEQYGLTNNEYLTMMQNAPGHIPEFALGIWLAMTPEKKIPTAYGFTAIALFILGNFYKALFPFTFISVAFITFWIASSTKQQNVGKGFLCFIGSLSMIIFVTNGFIRDFVVHTYANNYDSATSRYLFALIFIIVTIAISFLGKFIYNSLQCFFSNALMNLAKSNIIQRNRNNISILAKTFVVLILVFIAIFYISFKDPNIDKGNYALEETELTILPEDTYTSLAKNLVLDKNYVKLDIDIEFDILEHSEQLPVVVFEVGKLLWEKSEIKPDGKCTIHKKLIISNRTKKEKLKTYIWNPNKSRLRINNLKVYINGTSTL